VYDANRTRLAWTCGCDDLQQYASGDQHMTTDEARRIALAIARIPELMMK
jgi:ribosome biogenesis SPOUT family RNA methylase Rps3